MHIRPGRSVCGQVFRGRFMEVVWRPGGRSSPCALKTVAEKKEGRIVARPCAPRKREARRCRAKAMALHSAAARRRRKEKERMRESDRGSAPY